MYIVLVVHVCAHMSPPLPSPVQDVDQRTGEDLNPAVNKMLRHSDGREEARARNPDRPSNLASVVRDEESGPARGMTRMTSPEKWEIKQLIAAGVLEKSDYPGRPNDLTPRHCFNYLPYIIHVRVCTCTCMYIHTKYGVHVFVYTF